MLTIIIFILVLGVLIFVHEMGHFLVARRNGIKAEEFGFGFPPRIFGVVKDDESGKRRLIWGNKNVRARDTIYSFNWIPLGGFVKIKGEDGEGEKDEDSFVSKSAWTRVKVLAAGVVMNFVLAWVLLAVVFTLGAPEAISDEETARDARVQIAQVVPETPAEAMGLKVGDAVLEISDGKRKLVAINKIGGFQSFIEESKGKEIVLKIKRGDEILELQGVPREDYPDDQGSLGVSLARTVVKSYPFYESLVRGAIAVFDLTVAILLAFYDLIGRLIMGSPVGMDVAGPVGIAVLTGQVAALGFVYLLQFTAILSINLGIINALPIPALDGGRILFIAIEKFKGSPVSQKFEQISHTIGFALLILLMIIVTFRDLIRFDAVEKIKGLF